MIITFHSYKGGVGRSMALVNVGEALAQAGLRVLIVDFDLEAPSLETYYPDRTQSILDSPGIVDVLNSYRRTITPPGPLHQTAESPLPFEDIRSAIINVGNETTEGTVYMMPVGRRSGDNMGKYASAVYGFNWREFYENWEGELFFRWLRRQFNAHADVTLVDCSTGIKDISGICCGQIADAVVFFCNSNIQLLSGTKMMVTALRDSRLTEVRDAPLKLLVVPARIEFSEIARMEEFRGNFDEAFSNVCPDGITCHDMWHAAIPFIPYYSWGSHIVVREVPMDRSPSGLSASYIRLAEVLCRIASENSELSLAQGRVRNLLSNS